MVDELLALSCDSTDDTVIVELDDAKPGKRTELDGCGLLLVLLTFNNWYCKAGAVLLDTRGLFELEDPG